MKPALTVIRFAGRQASVKARIVANDSHALLIDTLRGEQQAPEQADATAASGKTLRAIVVARGHPDHFIGVRTSKERLPEARALLADAEVNADSIGFPRWMEGAGWLDAMPRMKVRPAANPEGLDDAGQLGVPASTRLCMPGGGGFELVARDAATEAEHMSTGFVAGIDALATSDLVRDGVHAWPGQGVTVEDARAWLMAPAESKTRDAHARVIVHPGHGAAGGIELLDRIRLHLCDFLAAAAPASTNAAVSERMVRLYPAHEQFGFPLACSVAHHGPDGRSAS